MPKHGSDAKRQARTYRPVPTDPSQLVSLYDTKPKVGIDFTDDPSRIKYPNLTEVRLLMKKSYISFSEDLGIEVPLSDQIKAAREIANMFRVWIQSYDKAYPPRSGLVDRGYEMFKADWIWARLTVNLQLRLLIEQVLYQEGYPWRRLVTGFKPVY